MALGDPYATRSELKGYLSIPDGDTDLDDQLDDALASVSREIELYCRRQFNDAGSASARVFDVESCLRAEVDDFHTEAGLIVRTATTNDGTYPTTWSSSDFVLYPTNGVVEGVPGWPFNELVPIGPRWFPTTLRRPPLEVTARWGWAAVPAPVRQACLILAAETFKLATAPFGVAGFGEFGVVRVRNNPMAAQKLAPYRRHPILVG